MELNAEQIIESLEFFHHRILHTSLAKKIYEAEIMAIVDALSLIKELTEENERLRLKVGAYQVKEALLSSQLDDKCDMCIARERADTVKKMQSEIEARCIKGGIYPAFVKSTIDQIAKEMLEEIK